MSEDLTANEDTDAVAAVFEDDDEVVSLGSQVAVTQRWLHEALTDRNRRISALTEAVEESTSEVKALREDLDQRPTRAEVAGARRRALTRVAAALVVLVFVAAYVAIFAHEQFRNACYVVPTHQHVSVPAWCNDVFPGVHPGNELM
jgi:hypothetical protein